MDVVAQMQEQIRTGVVSKTINPDMQGKHILGHKEYRQGRSYLLEGVDAQGLVDRYSGTGHAIEEKKTGKWKCREAIDADVDIGVNIDPITGEQTLTNRFTIHYSKSRTHIVPSRRR